MAVEDKNYSGIVPSPQPSQEQTSSPATSLGDEKCKMAAHKILEKAFTDQSTALAHVTPFPKGAPEIAQVATRTILPLAPEIERKWLEVKKLFERAKDELKACVPTGCAAYARLVLPKNVEERIGPLEFHFGKTGLKGGKEVGEDTLANIGSSGKVMTSLVAAVLEHRKYLRFDDSIKRYFPKEVMDKFQRDCNEMPVDPNEITVEMLSAMTAGLTFDSVAGVDASPDERSALSQDDLLRRPSKLQIPFISRPGDGICTYSNLQMQFLAYVIEKAYKEKALKELLQSNEKLAVRTIGSFLEKGNRRIAVDQVPPGLKNMTLRAFEKAVSNPKRQDAYMDGVYIHDIIDAIFIQEGETPLTFEEILKKELFQPLDIHEATYAPGKAVKDEGRVLAIGKGEVLAKEEGQISCNDNLVHGAGDLFMHPSDEIKFIQAMMAPELRTLDGHVLVPKEKLDALFTSHNRNLPSWSVGGTIVDKRKASLSIQKGGSLDEYHHNFRWERMRDPSRQDEAIGRFMWDNFLGTPDDKKFCRCIGRLYDEALSVLQPERASLSQPYQIPAEEARNAVLSEGKNVVPKAERFFQGDRGLMAYSKENFLYWAGVAYKIYPHEGKEYIFIDNKTAEIELFSGKDGVIRYLQVNEAQACEIPPGSVLEAAKTKETQRDLAEARELFSQLCGTYDGDHEPTGFHATFRGASKDNFSFIEESTEMPLQLIRVRRNEKGRIDELHVTWYKEPPDKMMKFVRKEGDSWEIQITEFLGGSLCETCVRK